MIISRAAGHQALAGPHGMGWRCLARRGMLHSECEVIDHWELDAGAAFDLNRCLGVEEMLLVVNGYGVLQQPGQPARDLRARQLVLVPHNTWATLVAGPNRRGAVVSPRDACRDQHRPTIAGTGGPPVIVPTSTVHRREPTGTWVSGMMRAAAVTAPGRVELSDLPVPGPEAGHALISVSHVGLCGTDLELLNGNASYLRDGRSRYPHVFGHEWSGVVVATADPSSPIPRGQRVVGHTMISCRICTWCQRGRRNLCSALREVGLYGQQGAAAQYISMPTHALTPVPDGVSDVSAALVEPTVTVLAGLAAIGLGRTDRLLVVGTGTIGLLTVQAAVDITSVDVVGVDDRGLSLALALGARHAYRPGEVRSRSYPAVVDASGAADAVVPALQALAPGGRLAAIGVPMTPVDGVNVSQLVLDGLSLYGIRHGLDHYGLAVELFDRGVLDAAPLIDQIVPLEAAAEAFWRLEQGSRPAPKIMLCPP